MYGLLAALFGFAFLYSLVGARLARTPISDAIVFTAFGLALGPYGLGYVRIGVDAELLRVLAELTLALVLFTDAAALDVAGLRRHGALARRLLLLGLPLTILLGAGVGWVLLPHLGLLGCALLGAILAPTDAALGRAVVTDPRVPEKIRRALHIEGGLNDGLCVPVLLLILEAARLAGDANEIPTILREFLFIREIGIGAAVGAVLGFGGARAIHFAAGRGWISGSWQQVTVVCLAFAILGATELLNGSGFIACFVGGIVANARLEARGEHFLPGAEGAANLFTLLTWVVFGMAAAGPAIEHVSWPILAHALVSLTVVRMLPTWVATAGLGMTPRSRLFVGWFGPRGLTSLIFAVTVLDVGFPFGQQLLVTVAWTVLLSILAHGLSAVPLAALYGRAEAAGATPADAALHGSTGGPPHGNLPSSTAKDAP